MLLKWNRFLIPQQTKGWFVLRFVLFFFFFSTWLFKLCLGFSSLPFGVWKHADELNAWMLLCSGSITVHFLSKKMQYVQFLKWKHSTLCGCEIQSESFKNFLVFMFYLFLAWGCLLFWASVTVLKTQTLSSVFLFYAWHCSDNSQLQPFSECCASVHIKLIFLVIKAMSQFKRRTLIFIQLYKNVLCTHQLFFKLREINVHCDVLSWLFFVISLGNTKICICQKEIFSHLQVRLVLIRLLFCTSGRLMVWKPSALCKDNCAFVLGCCRTGRGKGSLFIPPNRPWWRLHPLPSRSRRTVYILWLPHVTHLRVESLFL